MMKHNFILLLVLIAAMLVGCKPKNIDVDNALKQISEETFAKAPARSYVTVQDNDLLVIEYAFDVAEKTATRKQVNLTQTAAYAGVQTENFTYTWGEFKAGMFGRSLFLTGGNGDRTLTYLNDKLNDGEILTTINEPRADMASSMIEGLISGGWTGADPTYVLQKVWVDTIVYETHRDGKKIKVDTIFKRMPRPNYFDTIGIDSCFYYTYEFENGASSKPAHMSTHFLANIVTPRDSIVPQHQDPTKNDTMVLYSITPGEKEFRSKVDYSYWAITKIDLVKGSQNMDVVVGQSTGDPVTLPITGYTYDGASGSFVLDKITYLFTPKN